MPAPADLSQESGLYFAGIPVTFEGLRHMRPVDVATAFMQTNKRIAAMSSIVERDRAQKALTRAALYVKEL